MATPASGTNDPDHWLTLNGHPLSFQADSENSEGNATEYETSKIRPTPMTPDSIEILIDGRKLETEFKGRWDWTPKDYAGLYRLTVRTSLHPEYHTNVRVFPQKLTATIYDQMKADISAFAIDLLFQLHSEAVEKVDFIQRMQETSPLHDYRQIKTIIHRLQHIFAQIRTNPYTMLRKQPKTQDWHQVRQFSNAIYPVAAGGTMRLPLQGDATQTNHTAIHLPQKWCIQQNILRYDVYENRLLKQFLQQLAARLNVIEDRAKKELEKRGRQYTFYKQKGWNEADAEWEMIKRLEDAIRDCQLLKRQCLTWHNETFLQQVSAEVYSNKATPMLLKHPSYSRFYQLYLQLQQQFKMRLDTDHYITELSMRKVSKLYEMWSVFQVTAFILEDLLKNGYTFTSETLFYEIEKNYFHFDVRTNFASIILDKADIRVEIKYEPYYPNHLTMNGRAAIVATVGNFDPKTPDMVVEVYEKNIPKHILVFDAKYCWQKIGNVYYPKERDINTMRKYRDKIQYQTPQAQTKSTGYYRQRGSQPSQQRIVTSSYAIYPGNHLYEEPGANDIGALPLRPQMSAARLEKVRARLNDLLYQAYLID